MAGRTGIFELSLHGGKAPHWLLSRMKGLAKGILKVMADDYGVEEILCRLSDPLWFQALACLLAFDWDSSGTTTVTSAVLKSILGEMDLGLRVAGGKGAYSRRTPVEILAIGEEFNLPHHRVAELSYASRMSAKVDNAAIQAGYQLYHHTIFISERGDWAVVQQGFNSEAKTARRYHWLSKELKGFVDEPHRGIVGQVIHGDVLDMTAKSSEECRKVCTDIAKMKTSNVRQQYLSIRSANQPSLNRWLGVCPEPALHPHYRFIPENVNWKALEEAYELSPNNFEEVLSVKGIGPATVRGLALMAELIYGSKPSWRDPVRFSFAFGGKDGVPYPVNRKAMDDAIIVLREAVEAAEIGNREKVDAIKRLRDFASTAV
ncbi:MAG: DUF763 domain-containing protein [Candidatus Bathyarchaeia archaeon]